MTTETVNHVAAARAAMSPIERGIFSALATGLDYTAAGLVADADTVNDMRRTAQILSGYVQEELDDQLTELLYDAGHEHCDDEGCTGGGRAWYLKAARRLSDPSGPLAAVAAERQRQDDKWGEQNHPDGTGGRYEVRHAEAARRACDTAARTRDLTWRHILNEEVAEALAETDPVNLRAELVQVAAVAAAWVECLDRREGYSREAWYRNRPNPA